MSDVPVSVGGGSGASPAGYAPVPVAMAKSIAESYAKSIVIIFAHDPVFGLVHTTTYGTTPQNKAWAAQGGEIATKALGGLVDLATHFEDYRLEMAQEMLKTLKAAWHALKSYEHGNSSPELAAEIAQVIEAQVGKAERFLSSQGAHKSGPTQQDEVKPKERSES